MIRRFDEIELRGMGEEPAPEPERGEEVVEDTSRPASRFKRALALLTDLSLFFALALAMSPVLPMRESLGRTVSAEWEAVTALAGFLLLVSYYYFVGCWVIWGKTIGGAIFDVRIVSDGRARVAFQDATNRWFWMLFSIASAGIGFLPGLLRGGRTLSDRLSSTRAINPA
ncbi:MAG: RDD family protein [Thermoanaerobaculia bacterium]